MKLKGNIRSIGIILLAISIVIVSFTPIVIPQNTYKPELFGLPYSLWMGLIVTILMVILTLIATKIHPGAREAIKNEKDLKNREND